MMAAIEADDPAAMERCCSPQLVAGTFPTEQKDTCLTYAARRVSLKALKWLVHMGMINVNQTKYDGVTALYVAAQEGHIVVVQWLIQKGKANVNQARTEGSTLWPALSTKSMQKWLCGLCESDRQTST
jgi:hypothetical protein